MAQETKPDLGPVERGERGERGQPSRSPRERIGGSGGLAAILVVVAVVVGSLFALSSGEGTPEEVQSEEASAAGQTGNDQTTGPAESQSTVAERPGRLRAGGSQPAAPERGERGKVVMNDRGGPGGMRAVYVFADGRVIWRQQSGGPDVSTGWGWLERRLTPQGLDLLREAMPAILSQGSTTMSDLSKHQVHLDPLGLPAGVWEDPTSQPYRSPRYAVCPLLSSVAPIWRQLPQQARSLLRGSEEGYIHRCLVVTTEDARRLDQILSRADGFDREDLLKTDHGNPGHGYSFERRVLIGVFPVLPNATFDG